VHFLTTKERRNGEPDVAVYSRRAFAVKFLRQDIAEDNKDMTVSMTDINRPMY